MDYPQLAQEITAWLQERLREAQAQGFVLGLSGGVDSAVVAALCKRAAGNNVLGVWMPCHSMTEDHGFAQMTAEALGVQMITIDLSPAFDALMSALPQGPAIAEANVKPRLRMATLYYLAQSRNCLVVGTGNKPETAVGYFTKYGDGGVDLKPIGELLKREIRELARCLDVPAPIIERVPTAGLWPGQTDEGEMGITYAELDAILDAWAAGTEPSPSTDRIAKVRAMAARSAHKREMPPSFPVRRR